MEKSKVERINELARLKKSVGLTEEQTEEQARLRGEYIREYRAAAEATLENTYIQRPDGTREKLVRKDKRES